MSFIYVLTAWPPSLLVHSMVSTVWQVLSLHKIIVSHPHFSIHSLMLFEFKQTHLHWHKCFQWPYTSWIPHTSFSSTFSISHFNGPSFELFCDTRSINFQLSQNSWNSFSVHAYFIIIHSFLNLSSNKLNYLPPDLFYNNIFIKTL